MSREQSYQGFIIKKQPYGEADEIITLFTAEAGKFRVLAKGVKLGTSKLQPALQPIFLNRITAAGNGSLAKIISVQTLNSFAQIQDPERIKVWFVIAELLNKALPDEQKNELLFQLVHDYLDFLNSPAFDPSTLTVSLVKFKIQLMDLIGLQIHIPHVAVDQAVLFSASKGGFYTGQPSSDSRPVTAATWQTFLDLQTRQFDQLTGSEPGIDQLQDLVNQFVSWQLEREIKSDKFL